MAAGQLPKCKGAGHVKADEYDDHELAIYGSGETLVQYVADLKCRVSGTSGPGIIIGTQKLFAQNRGLHVQLTMARQLPLMLNDAAHNVDEIWHTAAALYHTADRGWIPWRAFDADGARDLANRINRVLVGV